MGCDADDELADLLTRALALMPGPRHDLPLAAFACTLRFAPMVNVDLVVGDGEGRVLLAWRADEFGSGWHVPGGIIRFREPAAARIAIVAESELGLVVEAEPAPFHVHEFPDNSPRGHFVSLLYRCRPASAFQRPDLFGDPEQPRHGEIAWFGHPPPVVYSNHDGTYGEAVWGPPSARRHGGDGEGC